MSETRTLWLSFVGDTGHLGCVLVDVTSEDAAQALAAVPWMADKVDGPWLVAAVQNARAAGCNPGGQVASWDLTGMPEPMLARYERLRLYSRADIEAIDGKPVMTLRDFEDQLKTN